MDNSSLPQAAEGTPISSEHLSEFSTLPDKDIPEAVRDVQEHPSNLRQRKTLIWGLGAIGAIAVLTVPVVWLLAQSSTPSMQSGRPATSPAPSASASPTGANPALEGSLLGHLPYDEAPESELESITDDGGIKLRQAAAQKFLDMVEAAKADGVNIVAISGFRSQQEQQSVFFDVQTERGEGVTTRAEVSAPPGYSEHHTGYAVDVGDSYYPDSDLKESFEKTPAFKWLKDNAVRYNFEMSFPKNNVQGVSYEPWHWRFVGDRNSLETFYRARSLNAPSSPTPSASSSVSPSSPSTSR